MNHIKTIFLLLFVGMNTSVAISAARHRKADGFDSIDALLRDHASAPLRRFEALLTKGRDRARTDLKPDPVLLDSKAPESSSPQRDDISPQSTSMMGICAFEEMDHETIELEEMRDKLNQEQCDGAPLSFVPKFPTTHDDKLFNLLHTLGHGSVENKIFFWFEGDLFRSELERVRCCIKYLRSLVTFVNNQSGSLNVQLLWRLYMMHLKDQFLPQAYRNDRQKTNFDLATKSKMLSLTGTEVAQIYRLFGDMSQDAKISLMQQILGLQFFLYENPMIWQMVVDGRERDLLNLSKVAHQASIVWSQQLAICERILAFKQG